MAQAISNLAVGSKVKLKVNGTDYSWIVVNQGAPSSAYTNADGTWLLMENVYGSAMYWGDGGEQPRYKDSIVHSYLNNTFFALLDASVQSAVKNATIPYAFILTDGVTIPTTSAKVFALGEDEVRGVYAVGAGSMLSYFEGAGAAKRIAYTTSGTAVYWWLRDGEIQLNGDEGDEWESYHSYCIDSRGSINAGENGGDKYYVRPAMILDSGFKVSNTTDSDGCYTLGPEPALYAGDANGIAQKVKKLYYGVNGIAQKVKKLYVGDANGKAQLVWQKVDELAYYGTVTGFQVTRYSLAAADNGTYAIFAGGHQTSRTVDAYDSSLTRSAAGTLSYPNFKMYGARAGNYAVFAGGYWLEEDADTGEVFESDSNHIITYDTSLTRKNNFNTYIAGYSGASASIGNNALFGGGYSNGNVMGDVARVSSSLTAGYLSGKALSVSRLDLAATTVGNYAIFAGGRNGSNTSYATADTFNASLTKGTTTALSVARHYIAATSVGNYALFAGGQLATLGVSNTVDAYNASLTRTVATPLSETGIYSGTYDVEATTLGNYAIFAGGRQSPTAVHCYDASLTLTTNLSLSEKRYWHKAATVGNYALFGGGRNPQAYSTIYSSVEAFTIA